MTGFSAHGRSVNKKEKERKKEREKESKQERKKERKKERERFLWFDFGLQTGIVEGVLCGAPSPATVVSAMRSACTGTELLLNDAIGVVVVVMEYIQRARSVSAIALCERPLRSEVLRYVELATPTMREMPPCDDASDDS